MSPPPAIPPAGIDPMPRHTGPAQRRSLSQRTGRVRTGRNCQPERTAGLKLPPWMPGEAGHCWANASPAMRVTSRRADASRTIRPRMAVSLFPVAPGTNAAALGAVAQVEYRESAERIPSRPGRGAGPPAAGLPGGSNRRPGCPSLPPPETPWLPPTGDWFLACRLRPFLASVRGKTRYPRRADPVLFRLVAARLGSPCEEESHV
ncbi:hypothetical protein MicloDRAFT_00010330 [Microvirga lotononidis]|uniref:Uncharacterized protein n=1 Tax=Microvirga lotononidis TaxID=864069 RepID=I4Z1Y6_9HYPH|nr:hypothetical protein MicloDRAFT_00010330 [Microvirga lotononidis]